MIDQKPQLPEDLAEKLEDFEFQYGQQAGRLGLAMDLISDAEIVAGVLGVYCKNGLDPRRPHPDVEKLQAIVRSIRSLVKSTFHEERARRKAELDRG